jgi:hypothetical protein
MGQLRGSAELEIAAYTGQSASIQVSLYGMQRIPNENEVFAILRLFRAGRCG